MDKRAALYATLLSLGVVALCALLLWQPWIIVALIGIGCVGYVWSGFYELLARPDE